jgi:hypothetical protein
VKSTTRLLEEDQAAPWKAQDSAVYRDALAVIERQITRIQDALKQREGI